jgi:transposase
MHSMEIIYLYRPACDMRKSFDCLCGLIHSELDADPLSGFLFVFCNRQRSMVKLLYWDRGRFAIWFKRLEQGTFNFPHILAQNGRIDRLQLNMQLEGVTPKKVNKMKFLIHWSPFQLFGWLL